MNVSDRRYPYGLLGYRHIECLPQVRRITSPEISSCATLALLNLLSSIGMVMLLHLAGRFSTHELVLGIYLMPGCMLGYFLAGRIARFLDQGYTRIAVLVISSASALLLILKA